MRGAMPRVTPILLRHDVCCRRLVYTIATPLSPLIRCREIMLVYASAALFRRYAAMPRERRLMNNGEYVNIMKRC